MGGGGGGDTEQTTKVEPFGPAKPGFKQIARRSRDVFSDNPFNDVFQGQRVAGFTPNQFAGQGQLTQFGQQVGPAIANQQNQAFEFLTDPQRANPQDNPFVQDVADSAVGTVRRELTEETLPQIDDQAIQQGAFTNNRRGLVENKALDDAARRAQETTSQIFSNARQQGLDTIQQGLQQAPQVLAANQIPGQTLNQVGQQQQQQQQRVLDARREEFNQLADAEEQQLREFANITGTIGSAGQNRAQEQSSSGSPAAGALGGAATGASVAGALSVSNPLAGAAIVGGGALLGALGS